MKASQLTEVLFKFYEKGRPKATDRTLRQADIMQMVTLAFGNLLRKRYNDSLKSSGEADYSFTSPVLQIKEFPLSDSNTAGMRRVEWGDFDLATLPYNAHITNVFPIGGTCGSEELGSITPVKNGEERYFAQPKFNFFKFYVQTGNGLNTYNVGPCATKIGIETTYKTDDFNISLDIGYDIGIAVLNILWKEKLIPVRVVDNSYDPNAVELKHSLANEEANI